jgi:putative transposase
MTPAQRHRSEEQTILAKRHLLYEEARAKRPERWSGKTRKSIGVVVFPPDYPPD